MNMKILIAIILTIAITSSVVLYHYREVLFPNYLYAGIYDYTNITTKRGEINIYSTIFVITYSTTENGSVWDATAPEITPMLNAYYVGIILNNGMGSQVIDSGSAKIYSPNGTITDVPYSEPVGASVGFYYNFTEVGNYQLDITIVFQGEETMNTHYLPSNGYNEEGYWI